MFGRVRVVAGVVALALGGAACIQGCIQGLGREIPTDRPILPSGLAVGGGRLVVVSSNQDRAFGTGAVLVADLTSVTAQLTGPDVALEGVFTGVRVPAFGDRPIFDSSGAHLFLSTEQLVHELVVDGGGLSCGGEEVCETAPHAFAVTGLEPHDIVLVSDDGNGVVRGFVILKASREAFFFTLNPTSTGADRLRVELPAINLGEGVFGGHSVALRPARDGVAARLFVATVRREGVNIVGTELLSFAVPPAGQTADIVPLRTDVTALVGARSARDIMFVDDGRAVIMMLHGPDALARFAVDDRGGLTLTALTETCVLPFSLAKTNSGAVLVTCFANNTVQLIDSTTLAVRSVARNYGRGPFDVVVTDDIAFVSFLEDNSIGALRIVDDALVPIGRLGKQSPRPEDGRE